VDKARTLYRRNKTIYLKEVAMETLSDWLHERNSYLTYLHIKGEIGRLQVIRSQGKLVDYLGGKPLPKDVADLLNTQEFIAWRVRQKLLRGGSNEKL